MSEFFAPLQLVHLLLWSLFKVLFEARSNVILFARVCLDFCMLFLVNSLNNVVKTLLSVTVLVLINLMNKSFSRNVSLCVMAILLFIFHLLMFTLIGYYGVFALAIKAMKCVRFGFSYLFLSFTFLIIIVIGQFTWIALFKNTPDSLTKKSKVLGYARTFFSYYNG